MQVITERLSVPKNQTWATNALGVTIMKNTNSKTEQAIAEAKKAILAVGKVDQVAREEGQDFAAQLKQATDAL